MSHYFLFLFWNKVHCIPINVLILSDELHCMHDLEQGCFLDDKQAHFSSMLFCRVAAHGDTIKLGFFLFVDKEY